MHRNHEQASQPATHLIKHKREYMKERPILYKGPMVIAIFDGTKTQTRRVVTLPCKRITAQYGDVDIQEVRYYAPPSGKSQEGWAAPGVNYWTYDKADGHMIGNHIDPCPYGEVGDQLWVKESFYAYGKWERRFSEKKKRMETHFIDLTLETDRVYQYACDPLLMFCELGKSEKLGWYERPSIFMPRKASRIQLEITGIRVERLHDISEKDAMAEGCKEDWAEGDRLYWFDGLGVNKESGRLFAYNAREAYSWLWQSINGANSCDANPWVWVIEFKRIKP